MQVNFYSPLNIFTNLSDRRSEEMHPTELYSKRSHVKLFTDSFCLLIVRTFTVCFTIMVLFLLLKLTKKKKNTEYFEPTRMFIWVIILGLKYWLKRWAFLQCWRDQAWPCPSRGQLWKNERCVSRSNVLVSFYWQNTKPFCILTIFCRCITALPWLLSHTTTWIPGGAYTCSYPRTCDWLTAVTNVVMAGSAGLFPPLKTSRPYKTLQCSCRKTRRYVRKRTHFRSNKLCGRCQRGGWSMSLSGCR